MSSEIDEDTATPKYKRACEGSKQELLKCLKESECVKVCIISQSDTFYVCVHVSVNTRTVVQSDVCVYRQRCMTCHPHQQRKTVPVIG